MAHAVGSQYTRWCRSAAAVLCAVSVGATVHCGSAASSGASAGDSGNGTPTSSNDAGGGGSSGSVADAGLSPRPEPPSTTVPDPNASGVLVVHASANMQAFRLCFGKTGVAGNLVPLPDRQLMPQSNVVGVEVGSAVRLKPLADVGLTLASNGGAPHKVYAIPEKFLRPPQRPANTPCAALLCPGLGGDCLDQNQFYELQDLPLPTYQFGVHVLAVSGCIAGSGDPASCGADFDVVKGNAKISSLDLRAYTHVKPNDFLVQIAQLSPALAGQPIAVSFGALTTTGVAVKVSSTFGDVTPPSPSVVSFDRTDSAIYASDGFSVDVAGISVRQSLASIQALSAPEALPGDYYSTRSNFVMLLLGNPADTSPTGGPKTPQTDPGKVVHLLGVPVGQPYAEDGGTDGGVYEAGSRDASDGG